MSLEVVPLSSSLVELRLHHATSVSHAIAEITLNRPAQRNALTLEMFDAFDEALNVIESRGDNVIVTLLTGRGPAFCAGFDLAAAVDEPALMSVYIERLSHVCRRLRRSATIVVVGVQGAALAGGCAIVTACDFVIVAPDAKLGYPVHRIGVSPAVTIPTLRTVIGDGATRSWLLGGNIIDGRAAASSGVAWRCAATNSDAVQSEALDWAYEVAKKGPRALRATKAWLNELDGSLDVNAFDDAMRASQSLTEGSEAIDMLRAAWSSKRT